MVFRMLSELVNNYAALQSSRLSAGHMLRTSRCVNRTIARHHVALTASPSIRNDDALMRAQRRPRRAASYRMILGRLPCVDETFQIVLAVCDRHLRGFNHRFRLRSVLVDRFRLASRGMSRAGNRNGQENTVDGRHDAPSLFLRGPSIPKLRFTMLTPLTLPA
jgi:hypothetical protein